MHNAQPRNTVLPSGALNKDDLIVAVPVAKNVMLTDHKDNFISTEATT